METKETLSRTASSTTMLEDSEYYKYIFKKTEKIACAVFYILRSTPSIGQVDHVRDDVEYATKALLNVSLMSLQSTSTSVDEDAQKLRHALITLESNLRVAHASRYISTEVLEVFLHEMDSVQRVLRKYIDRSISNPLSAPSEQVDLTRVRKLSRAPRHEQAIGSQGIAAGLPTRRERVLAVLKDKGEATIKDIIDVVTDCSEKTVQRELMSLIKDSIIVREGERRWSKYRLT